uniref:Uncharacterized protein n=1 Tax=Ditylenchus dipsaci TaxID=166011 RepID=A0A915DA53_9BILA
MLEAYLDTSKEIITRGSRELPCEVAKHQVVQMSDKLVEIDQSTGKTREVPEWRQKVVTPVRGEVYLPVLQPTIFKNLALLNISDIIPSHQLDEVLQEMRAIKKVRLTKLIKPNSDYRPFSADMLLQQFWAVAEAALKCWIYTCCMVVTMQFFLAV